MWEDVIVDRKLNKISIQKSDIDEYYTWITHLY